MGTGGARKGSLGARYQEVSLSVSLSGFNPADPPLACFPPFASQTQCPGWQEWCPNEEDVRHSDTEIRFQAVSQMIHKVNQKDVYQLMYL